MKARPRDLAHILHFLLISNNSTPFPKNLTHSLRLVRQLLWRRSVDNG